MVILPADLQMLEVEDPTAEHFVSRTGVGYVEERVCPDDTGLAQASGLAKSLLTGDPATARVINQSAQAGAARLFERMRAKFTD